MVIGPLRNNRGRRHFNTWIGYFRGKGIIKDRRQLDLITWMRSNSPEGKAADQAVEQGWVKWKSW